MRTTKNFFSTVFTFVLVSALLQTGCGQFDPDHTTRDGTSRDVQHNQIVREYYPCGVWGDAVELISRLGETHLTFAIPINMSATNARRIKTELSHALGAEAAVTSIQGRNFIIVNQPATLRNDQIGRIAIAMQNVSCD